MVPLPRRDASSAPVSAAHMPEMTKPRTLMRSTLIPARRAAAGLPPTAWISWPIAVRSTSTQRPDDERHDDDGIGDAEKPTAESQLQKRLRNARHDRHARRISERQPTRIVPTPSVAMTELTLSFVTMTPLRSRSSTERKNDRDGDRNRQLVVHH